MKNKKGISPLIATVLLIGFTVALAAVIMTWGLDYIKKITKGTEETTEEQLKCAKDLEFDLIIDCANNKIEVDALRSKVDIAEILLRIKDGAGNTEIVNATDIPMTGTKILDVTTDLTTVSTASGSGIDVLASIKLRSGKIIPCSQAARQNTPIIC